MNDDILYEEIPANDLANYMETDFAEKIKEGFELRFVAYASKISMYVVSWIMPDKEQL